MREHTILLNMFYIIIIKLVPALQSNISFYQSVAKIDVVKALFKFLFPLTSLLQIFQNLILTQGILNTFRDWISFLSNFLT